MSEYSQEVPKGYALKVENLKTDWPRKQEAVDLMNKAFWFYDTANKAIDLCLDPDRKHKMRVQLKRCSARGCGRGVSDMNEARRHLQKNRGDWTDENSKQYGRNNEPMLIPAVLGNGYITSAASCVSFLIAMEKKLKKLQNHTSKFEELRKKTDAALHQDNWELIGKLLGKVKSVAEDAKPFLWTAYEIKGYVDDVAKYADILEKLHEGASLAAELQGQGTSDRDSYAFSAVTAALGCLPILGGLYTAAVKWAVGYVPVFKQMMWKHTRECMVGQKLD